MLGAEIDFIVKGIDSRSRSVVASRKDAMLKKRQIFYLDTDASGLYRIYDGRIVQARVIAVAEKVIRVEIFGVECSIMARDLAWDWIGMHMSVFPASVCSIPPSCPVRIFRVRYALCISCQMTSSRVSSVSTAPRLSMVSTDASVFRFLLEVSGSVGAEDGAASELSSRALDIALSVGVSDSVSESGV